MELSIFLAKAFGLLMFLVGLGMLFDKKYYDKIFKNFTEGPAHLFVTGFLSLIIGIAIVTYHNIWQGEWWIILITIFGWLSLLKGVMRLLFPKMVMGWITSFMKSKTALLPSAVFALIFGVIFSYYGFFA